MQLDHLKDIERFRPKEKSVGMNVIVNEDNFFNKSENERRQFIVAEVWRRIELLEKLLKRRKMDTDIIKLKADLERVLEGY